MSLTMKELTRIFKSGVDDYHGVYLVIAALRDETSFSSCACRFWLDDILGDAGEKAAGGPTREDGQDFQKSSLTSAADPSVCEWTGQDEGPAHEIWKTSCGTHYERSHSPGWCGRCSKPIKFMEK